MLRKMVNGIAETPYTPVSIKYVDMGHIQVENLI